MSAKDHCPQATLAPRRRRPRPLLRGLVVALTGLGIIAGSIAEAQVATPSSAQGAVSGLPLPRFASLRAGEVNMRSGPGGQYPIDWIYKRRHLPIEVIAEFQTWRKVRDHQGTQGWVHQSMLGGERTAIVLGRMRTLRAEADSASRPLAKLQPDVIVSVLACPRDSSWCRARASGFEGWLRRVEIWGIRKGEVIE